MNNDELIQVLSSLKADIKVVSNSVSAIEKYLEKQNGRIGKSETAISQALEERASNRQKQLEYFNKIDTMCSKVDVLEKAEIQHLINCPIQPKLRVIEDTLLTQKGVKKFVALMFASGITLGGLIIGILQLIIN